MRKLSTIALVGWMAAGLAGAPLSALASEFPSIDPARAQVAARAETLAGKQAQLTRDRAKQDELAHRIAALKRLRAQKSFGDDGALEKLLQESLDAERALENETQEKNQAQQALELAVADAIRAIDLEITRRKPELSSATQPVRQAAARSLKSLLELRKALDRAGQASKDKSAPEAFARYQVSIGPLDGPSELREKADYVEDTRDKLAKKRAALASLLHEANQEREIARAASAFRTETSHFDEELRFGRVMRQSAAHTAAVGDTTGKTVAQPAVSGGGTGGTQNAAPPPAADSSGFSGAPTPPLSPNPPAGRGTGTGECSGAGCGTPSLSSGPAGSTSLPSAAITPSGAQVPKQIDPSTFLNLRVEDLDAATDVAALERLMSELGKLDAYLGSQASEIRRLAQHLENDEAKALGKDK